MILFIFVVGAHWLGVCLVVERCLWGGSWRELCRRAVNSGVTLWKKLAFYT